MLKRRTFSQALLLGLLLLVSFGPHDAIAQRSLATLIVPYPAGGPTDALARVLGEAISERTDQTIIIENRPGAGGQLAAGALLRAPADGRTLLLADMSTLSINHHLYKNFSHNPLVDFQPITTLVSMPMVLFVRRDLPADTFKELVELARTRNLNYASQGYGIPGHLLGEILRTSTNTRLTHVPYKGSAPAMNDLLGGQVDLLFDGLPAGLQHLASGKLKALAITSPRRSSLLPDIPTTTELGVPELNMNVWFGVVTHAAAPSAVAHESNRTFTETLKVKKVAQLFESQGFELTPMTPNAFSGLIKTESDRWHAVLKAHQIKID